MHPRDGNTGIKHRPSTKPAVGELVGAYEDGFADGFIAGARHAELTMRDFGHFPRYPARPQEAMARAVKHMTGSEKKRVGKKDPKMARALRKANSMGRKKSGGFKKGWSQGKIMRKAHQLRRRM